MHAPPPTDPKTDPNAFLIVIQPSWLKKWKLGGQSGKRKRATNCHRLLLAYKVGGGRGARVGGRWVMTDLLVLCAGLV